MKEKKKIMIAHQQKQKTPSNGKNLMNVDYNLLSVLINAHAPSTQVRVFPL